MLPIAAWAAACAGSGASQGTDYVPENDLPIPPATNRSDAGLCDGATCDAPQPDASVPVGHPGSAEPTNTCTTARDLGKLSGDTGSPRASATGTCSEWLRVRVIENDASPLGTAMKLRLTLTPQAHDFDLFAYLDRTTDTLSCATPIARSESNGLAVEVLELTWGEGTVANTADDSRTVSILVRSASGSCPTGTGWTLAADGNQ